MNNGPKNPATDPSGETAPERHSNREGARKSQAEHLIHREEAGSDARETSDGPLTHERDKGYRNTDEA